MKTKTDFEKFKDYMKPLKKEKGDAINWPMNPEEWLESISETFTSSLFLTIPSVFIESGGLNEITKYFRANALNAAKEIQRLKKANNNGEGCFSNAEAEKIINEHLNTIAKLTKELKNIRASRAKKPAKGE